MEHERGQSLIEVIVAVAVVAILLGVVLSATGVAVHNFVPDPTRVVLDRTVTQELHVAIDLLKYQGSSIPPATVATTVPMPTGTPMPVTLSVATQAVGGGAISVTVTATSGTVTASSSATIAARAPAPNSQIHGPSAAAPVALPSP